MQKENFILGGGYWRQERGNTRGQPKVNKLHHYLLGQSPSLHKDCVIFPTKRSARAIFGKEGCCSCAMPFPYSHRATLAPLSLF
ncbi:hypothetical protein Ddc_00356 [Ditylenchus destructor]|nr:hypothetical protein Ddc_00356 [Ditylenchus destructor]